MPPELGVLAAKFRTLVRGPKSCAGWHWRPSLCGCWGAGRLSTYFSVELPFPLWLGSSFEGHETNPRIPCQHHSSYRNHKFIPVGPSFTSSGQTSETTPLYFKLPHSPESHPLLYLFLPAEEENKDQDCRKCGWQRRPQPCQAEGGSSHPAVNFAFLVVPSLQGSFLTPLFFQNQLDE